MKSWKTPTPEQVEKAIALIVHPQQSSYFFNHLQNPKWISPLKKRDVLKILPKPFVIPARVLLASQLGLSLGI
jgi:flagellar biosynthesis/type III secretory pathway protein FliH